MDTRAQDIIDSLKELKQKQESHVVESRVYQLFGYETARHARGSRIRRDGGRWVGRLRILSSPTDCLYFVQQQHDSAHEAAEIVQRAASELRDLCRTDQTTYWYMEAFCRAVVVALIMAQQDPDFFDGEEL